MKDGRISQAGKYGDILTSGSDLMELVGAHENALASLDSAQTLIRPSLDSKNDDPKTSKLEDRDEPKKAQLVKEEEREKGKVGFAVYWKYITTDYGGALIPLILLAHISFQILQVGSNYWMAWATNSVSAVDATTLIVVFSAFSIASALCILFRETLLSAFAYKTATLFFDKMHFSIFRAPMAFFDATPSGRILNRVSSFCGICCIPRVLILMIDFIILYMLLLQASSDQIAVDMIIPTQFAHTAFVAIQILATIAIMSQVAWQVFVIFIPVTCVCLYYQVSLASCLSSIVGFLKYLTSFVFY